MATDYETTTPVVPPRPVSRSRSAWWLPPGEERETVYGLSGRDRWVLTGLLVPMVVLIGLHGWRWAETERSTVTVARATPLVADVAKSDTPAPTASPRSTTYVFRVDINTATWIEFAQLDGIGEKLAKRIVADRTEQGDFQAIEDLRRVKGIGAKTLEKMRPHLTLKADPAN